MIPVIIGAVEPDKFKTWWAFNYGENACEYASKEQCVEFFTQGKIIESVHIVLLIKFMTLLTLCFIGLVSDAKCLERMVAVVNGL